MMYALIQLQNVTLIESIRMAKVFKKDSGHKDTYVSICLLYSAYEGVLVYSLLCHKLLKGLLTLF